MMLTCSPVKGMNATARVEKEERVECCGRLCDGREGGSSGVSGGRTLSGSGSEEVDEEEGEENVVAMHCRGTVVLVLKTFAPRVPPRN